MAFPLNAIQQMSTTTPRRRIHSGGDNTRALMRYSPPIDSLARPDTAASRIRKRRSMLLGALLGFLIAMVLLMTWLIEHQVATAAERRARMTTADAAAARCLRLASHRATDACLRELEARNDLTD